MSCYWASSDKPMPSFLITINCGAIADTVTGSIRPSISPFQSPNISMSLTDLLLQGQFHTNSRGTERQRICLTYPFNLLECACILSVRKMGEGGGVEITLNIVRGLFILAPSQFHLGKGLGFKLYLVWDNAIDYIDALLFAQNVKGIFQGQFSLYINFTSYSHLRL